MSFWQTFHETITATVGAATWDAVKRALEAFANKTGEKVSDEAANWLMFKLFGVKTEDERRFNAAKAGLDPNDLALLNKKLGSLTSEQSDYYRITVMHEDEEKIRQILEMHARMSDADWQREVKIMNYDRQKAENILKRFTKWVSKHGANFPAAVKSCCVAGGATARAAGRGIATGARIINNGAENLADTLEIPRRQIENAANRINDQRRNRGRLKRIFGI